MFSCTASSVSHPTCRLVMPLVPFEWQDGEVMLTLYPITECEIRVARSRGGAASGTELSPEAERKGCGGGKSALEAGGARPRAASRKGGADSLVDRRTGSGKVVRGSARSSAT